MKENSLMKKSKGALILFSFAVLIISCKNGIALFDQYAYTQTTSIKVDALNVMELATDNFSNHKKEVGEIKTQMQKAYEYEKNRQKNNITVLMWEEMMKPSGKLFGGFITFWESHNTVSPKFIEDEKKLIGDAFDQIAQLEIKKNKN